MSEFTANAKGAAKQVASVLKGRAGIYATLAKEHGAVSSLLNQALETSSIEKRDALLDKIRVELLSHARAEEMTLYDALSSLDDTRAESRHSRSEHQEIEQLLVDALATSSDESIRELLEAVEHHVAEEENVLFVRADELLPREQEAVLNTRFKELKEKEKRRLEGNGIGWARGPVDSSVQL